jgi:hypothetical protein
MKLGEISSVGHNIADSLASGIGLLIGVYATDIFGEAAKSAEGFITVDFLTGKTSGGQPSEPLARAIELYAGALPALCERHRVALSSIKQLTASFSGQPSFERFVVTVEDQQGRRTTDAYVGRPGRRVKTLDRLGRIRRK